MLGKIENINAPINAIEKAAIIVFFSLYFSTRMPAGIDITPYAIKKAKGRNAESVKLSPKLLITSGFSAPRIFVISDMTKNVRKISPTI